MDFSQLITFILVVTGCSTVSSNDLEEEVIKDLRLTIEGKVKIEKLEF